MPVYVSPSGNHELWDEKPYGYFTVEQWAADHKFTLAEFYHDPNYEKRGDNWWKVKFGKREFLMLCGLSKVAALNSAINAGNVMVKTIHDILMAAEDIDVRDQAIIDLVRLLSTSEGGNIFTDEEVAELLQGVKHENKIIDQD